MSRRQAEIGLLKGRIEAWEELTAQKGSKLWKIIGPRIKAAKESAEKGCLAMVVEGKLDKAQQAAGQAIAYTHIFDEVENTSANIEAARARLSELRTQISAAANHGGIID